MITEELVAYVKQQRQAGVSDQAIREAILSVGWSQQDADEALVASAAQAVQKPTESETPEEQSQDRPSSFQEESKKEPAVEEVSFQGQPQETNQVVSQEESLDQQSAKEPSQEEVLPEQNGLHQQEDALEFSQEKESEEPEPIIDNQSGPVELDDQGRPITKRVSQGVDQNRPLKTENDLAKPVSFSPAGQNSAGEDLEPQEPGLVQEPAQAIDQDLPSQETPSETPPNQEPQTTQKSASISQEGSSQVAVDPKLQDK